MNRKPDMYDVIALLEESPRQRTSTPLGAYCCTEGEIGTVVMIDPDGECEVEFADRDG